MTIAPVSPVEVDTVAMEAARLFSLVDSNTFVDVFAHSVLFKVPDVAIATISAVVVHALAVVAAGVVRSVALVDVDADATLFMVTRIALTKITWLSVDTISVGARVVQEALVNVHASVVLFVESIIAGAFKRTYQIYAPA